MNETVFPAGDDPAGTRDTDPREPVIDVPGDEPLEVPTDPPVYIPTDVPFDPPGDVPPTDDDDAAPIVPPRDNPSDRPT